MKKEKDKQEYPLACVRVVLVTSLAATSFYFYHPHIKPIASSFFQNPPLSLSLLYIYLCIPEIRQPFSKKNASQ